jgi:signal transduction histidine kinase
VQVEDRGPGLPASEQADRLGLAGLADRIRGLGGSLDVGSALPEGARLTAGLPLPEACVQ